MTYKTTQRCCYIGYITQAAVINFAPLLFVIFQNTYDISYALIGTLIFINFAVQLMVDILSVLLLDKVGYRKSAVLSQLASAAGFILLPILPEIMNPYLGLCVAIAIASVGAGLIEVVINPIVGGLPGECEGNFILTHSFYCWGQLGVVLLTTLILKLLGSASWRVVSALWGIVPLVNGLLFIKTPIAPPVAEEKRQGIKALFSSKVFLYMLLLMVCAGGSELAMAQWASTFAQNALGVDKMVGDLMGPCLFAFFMGIGRTVYGLYSSKINYRKFASYSCVLCALCYTLAALSHNSYISLVGCALCGFAISTLWPGIVELAAREFPDGGGAMYSTIAIFGDIGCSVAPFVTGLVASMPLWGDGGLRAGLVSNIIYPIGFMLIINLLLKKRKSTGQ